MKYQVGQRVTGTINNIRDLGIFVTLPHRVSGLIHHNDFGNNWSQAKRKFQVGQDIRVVVIHNYHGKIALSQTRVNDDKLVDHTNVFSDTKPEDFAKVLAKTVTDADQEIKKLNRELIDYAN